MAKNSVNRKALEDLQKALTNAIADRADRIAGNMSEQMVDLFVERARKRLDKATPSASSVDKIEMLKNNIQSRVDHTAQAHTGYISVLSDSEGLNMFLEFGTGILGLEGGGHPEAEKKYHWKYQTRLEKGIPYKLHSGGRLVGMEKQGWFFSSKKGTYIDKNDEHPVFIFKEYKKQIKDKLGREYTRRVRSQNPVKIKENTVFTQGLRPLRYFYKTKKELSDLLSKIGSITRAGNREESGKKALQQIEAEIKKVRNKGV